MNSVILQYLQTATYRSRKGGGDFIYDCPICGGKSKLEVKSDRSMWYCHKCAKGGKLENFWARGNVSELMELLGDENFLSNYLPLETPAPRGLNTSILPYDRIMDYLDDRRGLKRDHVHQLFPHIHSEHPDYVFFPVYELGASTPCFFVGRSIFHSVTPKYLLPPVEECLVRKSEMLWGLHRIHGWEETIYLFEGIFDSVWQRTGLAMLGKRLSRAQARIVKQLDPKQVVIVLDGGFENEVIHSVKQLRGVNFNRPLLRTILPPGEDPDSWFRAGKELPGRERIG